MQSEKLYGSRGGHFPGRPTLPGVLMVFHLTGVTDYLVWVAASDAQDLREFVVDHLATHPSVAHAETSLIYEHQRGPGIWGAADPA